MKLSSAAAVLAAALGVSTLRGDAQPVPAAEWPVYGGDAGQRKYSPLRQITRDNVKDLRVAWSFDTGESGGLQTNPVVMDGVLYVPTPTHKVIALDAATGALKWRFDSGIAGRGPNRGVTLWRHDGGTRVFTAQDQYLYALDAATGRPITAFGRAGRIDLREGLGRDPELQSVRVTTPGLIFRDLLIVGSRTGENLPASPGHIRAYDAGSGALRWTFHTIPQPGEFGHDTWPADAWTYSGGANNWAGMALDEQRGILFAPTGSAAPDFYGGRRLGDNLFANTLLALDAATGRRLWHFQAVHHDIWDRDFPAPPTLATVTRAGTRIDAVTQTTKHGQLFVFERASGRPLFPIEERPFPPSDVMGERAAATQPMPVRPEPFARQLLTEDMLTTRTPEAQRAARDAFRTFRSAGQFVPLTVGQQTVVFPGFDGGAEWGGSAFDPETGLLYVNANEMAWTGGVAPSESGAGGRQVYLRECAACHRDDLRGTPPQFPSLLGVAARRAGNEITAVIRQGAGRMPGFPALAEPELAALLEYLRTGESVDDGAVPRSPLAVQYRFTGFRKFLDPDGYPAIAPPWGTLSAIDLATGNYAWRIPLGEYPELAAQGITGTGSENYGGPVVTAGGLVFIGATNFDRKVRAFDKTTGLLLWETLLPYAANGTPATYETGGRQFLVVPAGGGKGRPGVPLESGGVYVAFALP